MRCAWTIGCTIAAVSVIAAGSASGQASNASSRHCRRALPEGSPGLPAPVIVTTRCGRFRLEPSGKVSHLGAPTLPVPRGASYWADLTWYRFSRGHLLVGRGHRRLWRSRHRYPGTYPGNIGVVVVGTRELAFSYYPRLGRRSRLYLARYGAAEKPLARDETPLAFLASGELVTWRARGWGLVLRGQAGRFRRLIVPHAVDPQVDRQSHLLVFRVGEDLRVFDGDHVRELARLRQLGIKGYPVVEPFGRGIAVHDRTRLAVLGYDGRLVSQTALPPRAQPADMVSSSVVSNARGTSVAFTATSGNTAYGSSGRETIYVLRAGEAGADPVFTQKLDFEQCERMATLAWHGDWLLYSASENRAAVIDSSLRAPAIELGSLIQRLPGFRRDGEGFFDIGWATHA